MGIGHEAAIDWIKAERRALGNFTQSDRLPNVQRNRKFHFKGGKRNFGVHYRPLYVLVLGVTRPSLQALAAGSKRRTGCTG
jgi:hypothetical protein